MTLDELLQQTKTFFWQAITVEDAQGYHIRTLTEAAFRMCEKLSQTQAESLIEQLVPLLEYKKGEEFTLNQELIKLSASEYLAEMIEEFLCFEPRLKTENDQRIALLE